MLLSTKLLLEQCLLKALWKLGPVTSQRCGSLNCLFSPLELSVLLWRALTGLSPNQS